MWSVLLIFIIMGVTCYPAGFALLTAAGRLLGQDKEQLYGIRSLNRTSVCMAGLVTASVYAQVWSLYGGVSSAAFFVFAGLSVLAWILLRGSMREYGRVRRAVPGMTGELLTGIPLSVLLALLTSTGYIHYDSDLYHAQAIRWAEQYGTVRGLANLHNRLGCNSAAFPLDALFSFSFTGRSYHAVTGFAAVLLWAECLRVLRSVSLKPSLERQAAGRWHASDFVRTAAMFYLFTITGWLVSPVPDYLAVMLAFYVVIRFLSHVEEKERNWYPYAILAVLAAFAGTVQAAALPLAGIGLWALVLLFSGRARSGGAGAAFTGIGQPDPGEKPDGTRPDDKSPDDKSPDVRKTEDPVMGFSQENSGKTNIYAGQAPYAPDDIYGPFLERKRRRQEAARKAALHDGSGSTPHAGDLAKLRPLGRGEKWKNLALVLLWMLLVLTPYFARNVLLSGYLIYPLAHTGWFSVPWKVPYDLTLSDLRQGQTLARGLTDPSRNFDAPVSAWFSGWFRALAPVDRAFFAFAVLSVVVVLILFLRRIVRAGKHSDPFLIPEMILEAVLAAGLAVWFFHAPQMRYGCMFVYSLAALNLGLIYLAIPLRDKERAVAMAMVLFLGYKIVMVGADEVRMPFYENLVRQQDYSEYDMTEYTIGTLRILRPTEGDQAGYAAFPSSAEDRSGKILPLGENLRDGFRAAGE